MFHSYPLVSIDIMLLMSIHFYIVGHPSYKLVYKLHGYYSCKYHKL